MQNMQTPNQVMSNVFPGLVMRIEKRPVMILFSQQENAKSKAELLMQLQKMVDEKVKR